MKKTILLLASVVCIYTFNSCTSKNESSTTSAGTDSSMMTTTTTTASGLPSSVKPDSTTNPSGGMDTTSMAIPDPAKKGKKGKVILSLENPVPVGSEDAVDVEGFYTNVYPAYPGGNNALASYFQNNIQYPQDAIDNGVDGIVNISFTVDEKGKVGSPRIVNKKIGYGLEEEAMRVFNKMPTWKAGALKGKNVKTRYTLPVRFQLES